MCSAVAAAEKPPRPATVTNARRRRRSISCAMRIDSRTLMHWTYIASSPTLAPGGRHDELWTNGLREGLASCRLWGHRRGGRGGAHQAARAAARAVTVLGQ